MLATENLPDSSEVARHTFPSLESSVTLAFAMAFASPLTDGTTTRPVNDSEDARLTHWLIVK